MLSERILIGRLCMGTWVQGPEFLRDHKKGVLESWFRSDGRCDVLTDSLWSTGRLQVKSDLPVVCGCLASRVQQGFLT